MNRTTLEIYALSVCFVFVILISIATSLSIATFSMFTWPEHTIGLYSHEKHLNNENYWESVAHNFKKKPSEEQLTKLREKSYKSALLDESHTAKNEFEIFLIFNIVFIVIFYIHWKMARRLRQHAKET